MDKITVATIETAEQVAERQRDVTRIGETFLETKGSAGTVGLTFESRTRKYEDRNWGTPEAVVRFDGRLGCESIPIEIREYYPMEVRCAQKIKILAAIDSFRAAVVQELEKF